MKKTLNIVILIFIIAVILCAAILIITMTQRNFDMHSSPSTPNISSESQIVVSKENTAQNTSSPLASSNESTTPATSSTVQSFEASSKPTRVEKEESVPATTIKEKPTVPADSNPIQTYEENKRKHEEEVKKYLEENNIDKNTAGETGEACMRCGKKLWNPDKYGFNNPGYPADYENSGYCTGACGIALG